MTVNPNMPNQPPFFDHTHTLTREEKSLMRKRLANFMQANPPRTARSFSFVSLLLVFKQYRTALAALGIIVLTGGTAFAAQDTLPGDSLYPVKVRVTERIESAFALTPQSVAAVEAKHALTRLEEAEELVQQDKFNDENKTTVAAAFSGNVSALQTQTKELEDRGENEKAERIHSEFKAKVNKHRTTLLQLSLGARGTTTTALVFDIDSALAEGRGGGNAATTVRKGKGEEADDSAAATPKEETDKLDQSSEAGTLLLQVLLGPTCPVERVPEDPLCAPKGFSTVIEIRNENNVIIMKKTSDAEGILKIDLPFGDYRLTPNTGTLLQHCSSEDVHLQPKKTLEVTLSCDTGIR